MMNCHLKCPRGKNEIMQKRNDESPFDMPAWKKWTKFSNVVMMKIDQILSEYWPSFGLIFGQFWSIFGQKSGPSKSGF